MTICKRCGSSVSLNAYCTNLKCPYSDWSQKVKFSDLIILSEKQVEQKYQIKKRPRYDDKALADEIDNWDDARKIELLENFIESYGLDRELKVYLHKIAKENC